MPLFDDCPDTWLGPVDGERFYYPVGNTDSEKGFCAILNALRAQFPDTMPSLPVLHEILGKLCQEIVDYDSKGTILNFLLVVRMSFGCIVGLVVGPVPTSGTASITRFGRSQPIWPTMTTH
jgi:hypothetical protein